MVEIHKKVLSRVQFNNDFFLNDKPVILKNSIDINYLKPSPTDWLRQLIGHKMIKLIYSKKGYYNFADKKNFIQKTMLFSKALSKFRSEEGKSYYLLQSSIPDNYPEINKKLLLPYHLLQSDIVNYKNLWVGGKGCVSPLHYDFSSNFLMQIEGRKKLTLFSPNNSQFLYPSKNKGEEHLSLLDIKNVNLLQFPLFKNANAFNCILNPGDVLYIPPGWWHQVESLDFCISINIWFERFDIVKDEMIDFSVEEVVEELTYFIKMGWDINGKDCDGEYFIFKAIRLDLENVIKAFIKLNVNIELKSLIYSPGLSAYQYYKKINGYPIERIIQ